MLFTIAMNDNVEGQVKTLSEACQRFCRCIELCNDYLRGYYGLKKVGPYHIWRRGLLTAVQTTDRLLAIQINDSESGARGARHEGGETATVSEAKVRELNELATSKLAKLAQRLSVDGNTSAEVIAVKKLLDERS